MAKHTNVDPVIVKKLRAFGRRRRRLIVMRGLCAAVVSLLAAMSLVALPDYLFVLTDTMRLVLSVTAYAAAVVAVWITCVRMMLHIPSEREVARMMESTAPGLREDLISAVELGSPASDPRFDSPIFRQLLQESVARRVTDVDIRSLLPWRLVAGWLLAGVAVVVTCATLSFIPGVSFGSMLGRAMMPTADIERVSRVKIDIVEPTGASAVMPEGDAVRIVAQTSGGEVDDATLETFAPDGTSQRLVMTRQDDRRFAGTFVIGKEPVTYRVLAGDGVTRKFTLTSKPRPYITAFEKTFRYPAYTRLDPQTRSEKDGDVAALEGTDVELVLTTDQPVASGELRIEQGRETKTIPLRVAESGRVTATLPVTQSGTYKVSLVAATTHFENKFSPKYEINAQPDLPPRVEMTQPRANLLLPPDEIVGLRGTAEDDLALVSVQQMIRVNAGPWTSVPLADEPGAQAAVERAWDLFELKLRAGDKVTTKLVATDRKGSRGESAPLIVTVSSPEFDSKRLVGLEAKAKAEEAVRQLASRTEQHRKNMEESAQKLLTAQPDTEQAKAYRQNAVNAAKGLAADAETSLKELLPLIRLVGKGADAHDMALAARIVAQVEHGYARTAEFAIAAAVELTKGDERGKQIKTAISNLREAQSETMQLSHRVSDMLSDEVLAVVTNDLRTLAADQARVQADVQSAAGAADATTWKRVARREGIAVNHTKFLEELLNRYSRGERGKMKNVTQAMAKLAEQRTAVDTLLSAGEPDQRLAEAARRMKDAIDQAHQQVRGAEAEQAKLLAKNRRSLEERADPVYRAVDRLDNDVNDAAKYTLKLQAPTKTPRDAKQVAQDQRKRDDADARSVALDWPAAVEMLKAVARIEEARPDTDARFAADTGLASRALTGLQGRYLSDRETDAEGLKRVSDLVGQINRAMRTLESIHRVSELDGAVGVLAEMEQWKIAMPAAHTLHPRQWDVIDPQMDYAAKELKWNKSWREPMQLLTEIPRREPAQAVRTEMEGRRGQMRAANPVRPRLLAVKADVDKVLAMLEPDALAARAMLEQVSPKMAELMRQTAERARKLEEKTKQAAADAAHQPPQKNAEEAQAVAKQQQSVRAQLSDVVDAVRQDANLQNLMTDEGRERARDADAATAMLREPANRADAAVEKALKAMQQPEQGRALEQAAAEQAKLAATLEKLAEHYEKMEAGQDVTASREEMRQAEREIGVDRPLNQQYQQLEKLSQMSQLPPAELMKQLEAELGQNRPMQRELDQISRSTVQQAQSQLAKAAEMEKEQAKKVDAVAQQQAKTESELGKQLEQMKKQAQEIAEHKAPEAKKAAEEAKMAEPASAIGQAGEKTAKAAEKLPAQADKPAEEIGRQLTEQAKPLKEAAAQLQQAAKQTAEADQAAKAESKNTKQMAEAAANQAKAEQQAQPDSPQAAEAAKKADQASKMAESMQAKAQQTAAAQETAQKAAAMAQELAQKTEQLGKSLEQQAAEQHKQIAHAAQEQKPIAESAMQASEDVARAARHEMRLGNEEASEQLQQQAAATAKTATTEVPEAKRQLEESPKAAEAHPAVKKAAEALAQNAQQLGQMLDGSRPPTAPPPAGAPPATPPSETQQMANSLKQPGPHSSPKPATPPTESKPGSPAQASAQPSTPPGTPPAAQSGKPSSPSSHPPAPQPGSSPFEGASAEYLARALDQLDQAMNQPNTSTQAASQQMANAAQAQAAQSGPPSASPPSPGAPQAGAPGTPGAPTPAQQALNAAAAAQAAAMMANRAQGLVPGESPLSQSIAAESTKGATVDAGDLAYGALPGANRAADEQWGKLPPQLAKDLMEGRREGISPEYRAMVEAYFRALATKAQGKPR